MNAFILAVFFIAACGTPDDECICPEIYMPVCGDDGVTYGNSCEADCAGVSYTDGECDTAS